MAAATAAGFPTLGRREMPVCRYWLQGRCTRLPCPFLHSDLGAAWPPAYPQRSEAAMETQQRQRCRRSQSRNLVWRNPNCTPSHVAAPSNPSPAADRTPPTHPIRCAVGNVKKKEEEAATAETGEGAINVPVSQPPQSTTPLGHEETDKKVLDEGTFSFVGLLKGHSQSISGIAIPSGSDKLVTGSEDGAIRIWSCVTGQCLQVVELGGTISCMVPADREWIFAGGLRGVCGYNILTGAVLSLPGSTGQVCSLATSTDTVFAGMADSKILVWETTIGDAIDGSSLCFHPVTSLDGHTSAVVSLTLGYGHRLYSGSVDRSIRVWNLQTLQCVHTVVSAHDDAVTSLLCWDYYLLSGSLDSTIKVWESAEAKEGDTRGGFPGLKECYVRRHEEGQGVLLLDGVGKNVLLCSLADETVRLYDLPSFSERGCIEAGGEVRAMHSGPCSSSFFFIGDADGDVSVWKCDD